MPHSINVRQDNEASMRAYVGKMPEIAPEMAKYSWVKSLDGLSVIPKLAIGLIAYPVAYLRDWCNKHSIKQHTLEEARKATMAQLQTDMRSVDLPARRVLESYNSITPPGSELDLGFLEKTTSRYRQRLKEEAEQFAKKQFPFPCILKLRPDANTDEVNMDTRSVVITYNYDIYYEDICVGMLKVTSKDYFQGKTIQGQTVYEINTDPKSTLEALERHHLYILRGYLLDSFKLDIRGLTIEPRHSEKRMSETSLGIRKKYTIHYYDMRIGEASFTGNFEIRNGKTQGSMKHRYDLNSKLEKIRRAKTSI